mgnify:CR=1 FL=1
MNFSNRYLLTLVSSGVRAALAFTVSIQIAKYLAPELYGSYQYILTVSTAILLFMNMSTESAFFTLISKKKRHVKFYFSYFSWQLAQILVALTFLFLIHRDLYTLLFKDFNLSLVALAFGAAFLVGNIQATVNHIVESIRKTYLSQVLSIFVAFIHVAVISGFVHADYLPIKLLFTVLIFEYLLYATIILFVLKKYSFELFSNDTFIFKSMVEDFYVYCRPLFVLGLFSFLYVFVDRWLIQTYVGKEGQAYFSISMQFSALTMLVTSSILKIFWKEISESIAQKNFNQTRRYFSVVSLHLFIIACVLSSVLFFFSDEILSYFYSDAYVGALLVFKLVMLYPIVQSMGQLYSVFLLGTDQTKLYKNISIWISVSSIAVAIFLLSDFGLNAGVEGIAVKLVLMNVISIMILEYFICDYLAISTTYWTKLKYLTLSFLGAYIVHELQIYMDVSFLVQILLVGFLYVLPIGIYLFKSLQRQLSDV